MIDLDPHLAAARRAGARAADRFESEQAEFFERVRGMYLERARQQPHRFEVVDGRQAPDAIQRQILGRVAPWHA